MNGDPSNEKRALRAELRERRRNLTVTEREAATDAFTQHLVDLTSKLGARSVSAYLPHADEPNIRRFIAWALEQGIQVLLPISRDDGLLDWVVTDGESEAEGPFGWPEPVGELVGPIAINDVDLIIVPAAAVDRTGMRMGWGRGYYDRTLGSMEQSPPVYAVIFDNEFVEAVPTELHDKPVGGVVTPSGVVSF